MKVELQNGDRLTVPNGCKATINGNEVVIEKGNLEFKDGDVLVSNDKYQKFSFIFKGDDNKGFHKFYVCLGYYGDLIICKEDAERCGNSELSLATEEEKQCLFDKMKEQGLRWNAEGKRVEKIIWRAKESERYYHLDALFTVQHRIYKDCFSDREMVKKYNHFRTKELAKEAAEVVKEALKKFHENE